MSKPQMPEHLQLMLLQTPPPRHACPHCTHIFHVQKDFSSGTWVEGLMVFGPENAQRMAEAFFVICPKCKNIALPFVLSRSHTADELRQLAQDEVKAADPTQPATISYAPPPKEEPRLPAVMAPQLAEVPTLASEKATPKLSPADILAGKGRAR